jgi:uncharacterized membrane protein YraQ (UPF0718 family)
VKSTSPSTQWRVNAAFAVVIGTIMIVAINPKVFRSFSFPQINDLNTFKTMFISIVLEAMPFLLLGVFVSSIMQVYIPESWIRRVIPRNPLLGVLVACLLGIVFPVCECGLIPIVRRLVSKGMPLYAGVAFFLAGPIVNPIVYSATFAAFRTRPEMVYARMGLAVAVSATIGLIVYVLVKLNPFTDTKETYINHSHAHAHAHTTTRTVRSSRVEEVMKHAGGEFFDMGKYLILGSLITAFIQAFVPRAELTNVGQGEFGSHLFMMGFAFILSLCSTSDAFVASSFVSTFSASSLLTFLVFGPMLDLKGTLMLLSVFKPRFVLLLAVIITFTVLVGSWIVGKVYLG